MSPEERQQMITDNLTLVWHVVHKIYLSPYSYYDREDMYQQGVIGLIKAVDKFDPEKGFQFSTYAVPMIHGEIRRFVRDNSQSMRYRRSDIEALTKVSRTGKSIDDLTASEIEELGLTLENISAIRTMNMVSTDAMIGDSENTTIGDLVANPVDSELSAEFQIEEIEKIKDTVLKKFESNSQDLLDEWYYSTAIGMEPTQMYLGRKYDLSQAQVSRTVRKFKEQFARKLERAGYDVPNLIREVDED